MCSYCGCDSVDVLGRFMAEHESIVNAAGVLRRACEAGDGTAVTAAADRLGDLLRPHTAAEEAGLFAVLAEDDEFTDHVRSLCAEHTTIEGSLARVRAGDHASYPAFEATLRRHIDREENGLFPAAAVAFAGPEWGRVATLTPAAGQP